MKSLKIVDVFLMLFGGFGALTLIILFTLFQTVTFLPGSVNVPLFPVISSFLVSVVSVLLPLVVFFVVSIRARFTIIFLATLLTFWYAINLLLVYYYLTRQNFFDFFYFWLNRNEAFETLQNTYSSLYAVSGIIIIVLLIFVWFFIFIRRRVFLPMYGDKRVVRATPFFVMLFILSFFISPPFNKLISRAQNTYEIAVRTGYGNFYRNSVMRAGPNLLPTLKESNSIIVLHLESLNSEFVRPEITPALYRLSKNGILFTRHQSNTIQTKRALEVILCGSLPSVSVTLHDDFIFDVAKNEEVYCLPRILQALGYRTIFFVNYDINFQELNELMPSVGFQEIHGSEIMHENDPRLMWGHREDIFYQRIREYLEKNIGKGEKLFIHIVTGSTNHHNFYQDPKTLREDIFKQLPNGGSLQYYSRREDSAFAQDAYVDNFIQEFKMLPFFSNSDLFIYGDHPVGIDEGRPEFSYNTGGIEQKYFYTTLAFIPGEYHRSEFATSRVVEDNLGTSHIGIAPTIMELLGYSDIFSGDQSFYETLLKADSTSKKCVVNVQPYFDPGIALVEYPHKIVLHPSTGTIEYTYLNGVDPNAKEEYTVISDRLEEAQNFIEACRENRLSSIVDSMPSVTTVKE